MKVCVFGLGDEGSALAADLAVAGADVAAYDPASVATPTGVRRLPHPSLAAARSTLILAATSEVDAEVALLQALEVFSEDVVYADLSNSRPAVKRELASMAAASNVQYADVAFISDSNSRGLSRSSLVCGEGADLYAERVGQFGGRVEIMDGDSGAASRRKLLRSAVLAGTAAVISEAMRAADAVDDQAWLWANISDELSNADDSWLRQLISDQETQASGRLSEIEAAKSLIDELGVRSTMSGAVVQNLQDRLSSGTSDGPGFPS